MKPITDHKADLWSDLDSGSARAILLAAVDAFSELGYTATTTRNIAQRVQMSPAAVYVHYSSKAELLTEISRRGHDAVLTRVRVALDQAGPTPGERLAAFVESFTGWHAENHVLARVIQYELRSLPDDAFAEMRALRRQFTEIVRTILKDGVASGTFDVPNIELTTVAILSLGIDVARWYTLRRIADPGTVGPQYAELALRMVSAASAAALPPR